MKEITLCDESSSENKRNSGCFLLMVVETADERRRNFCLSISVYAITVVIKTITTTTTTVNNIIVQECCLPAILVTRSCYARRRINGDKGRKEGQAEETAFIHLFILNSYIAPLQEN